jgi:diphthamide biosynthesis protein 7
MYGGFFVLDYADTTKPPFIVAAYKEHESLAYGSDWCHLVGEEVVIHVKDQIREADGVAEELRIVATCSFYDHKLCVSSLNRWSTE